MHKDRKKRAQREGGKNCGKSIVLGMLERETEKKQKRVRASVLADRSAVSLRPEVQAHVEPEQPSTPMSSLPVAHDGSVRAQHCESHEGIRRRQRSHQRVENFWSLLKRGIGGTYVSVEPFHLFAMSMSSISLQQS